MPLIYGNASLLQVFFYFFPLARKKQITILENNTKKSDFLFFFLFIYILDIKCISKVYKNHCLYQVVFLRLY